MQYDDVYFKRKFHGNNHQLSNRSNASSFDTKYSHRQTQLGQSMGLSNHCRPLSVCSHCVDIVPTSYYILSCIVPPMSADTCQQTPLIIEFLPSNNSIVFQGKPFHEDPPHTPNIIPYATLNRPSSTYHDSSGSRELARHGFATRALRVE